MGLSRFPSHESPQQSQQDKHRKQVQQQDIPQQQHRTMHVTTERTIKPPIIIAAMTGHLQYVAAIQLSQLEKVFLTLETSEVIDLGSEVAVLLKSPSATKSTTPHRKLLVIAVVMCGISTLCKRNHQFGR
jgi:hypothetical protein